MARIKRQPPTLYLKIRESNTDRCGIHSISIPRKVRWPKVVSQFESVPSYPDVDEGYFLHKSFGKYSSSQRIGIPQLGMISSLMTK